MLTLSLVVCLGAADVSATVGPRAESAEHPRLTVVQRRALASLLSELTDTARRFQHASPSAAAMLTPQRGAAVAAAARAPSPTIDRADALPTPPLRAALRNLPPPRCA